MKKMVQLALINPSVNLELFHESLGVKEPLWLPIGSQDDGSHGCLLAHQSNLLTLVQVLKDQSRNT